MKRLAALVSILLLSIPFAFSQEDTEELPKNGAFAGVLYGPLALSYIANTGFVGSMTFSIPMGVYISEHVALAGMPSFSISGIGSTETPTVTVYSGGLSAMAFVQAKAMVASLDIPLIQITYSATSGSAETDVIVSSFADVLQVNFGLGVQGILPPESVLPWAKVCWMAVVGLSRSDSVSAFTIGARFGMLN